MEEKYQSEEIGLLPVSLLKIFYFFLYPMEMVALLCTLSLSASRPCVCSYDRVVYFSPRDAFFMSLGIF